MMTLTLAVGAQRSYRRRVGLLRSTDRLPTDPWQLFNISITQTGNRTEGKLRILMNRCTFRVHATVLFPSAQPMITAFSRPLPSYPFVTVACMNNTSFTSYELSE